MFRIAAYTDIGVQKDSNQDAYYYGVASSAFGDIALAVICDGVGGMQFGERASSMVARRFARWFEDEAARFLAANSEAGLVELSALEPVWRELIEGLNSELFSYGEQRSVSLGTTFTGAFLCQGRYFIGHVGDCRCYRLHRGMFASLTEDQTLVGREVARGNLTDEEAAKHPQRNVILQAVGARETIKPAFYLGDCDSDDLFLLCCDGLHREVKEAHLRSVASGLVYAREEDMRIACEGLAADAIAAGGTDNITLICLTNAELVEPAKENARSGAAKEEQPTAVMAPQETLDYSSASLLPDDSDTRVLDADDAPTTILEGDDAPTIVLEGDDAPTTMLEDSPSENDGQPDDAPTTILSGSDPDAPYGSESGAMQDGAAS